MTENLLQKLEDKIILLVKELNGFRQDNERLTRENNQLKTEYGEHTKKLQHLISLLDSLNSKHLPNAFSTEELS